VRNMIVGAVMASLVAGASVYVFLCMAKLRQCLLPPMDHRLGKWLAFHGGVR
jgi:hypothetical protein